MIFKNQDVNADINIDSVDLGNIHANFYTEDRGIASIRIFINSRKNPIDLKQTQFKPKLNLFLQDGSIFMDEPVQVVMADKGIVQYNLRDEVIKHSGKVSAKLFLVKENESIHVANFDFNIVDSGVNEKVQKEIKVNLVEDSVRKIMSENAMGLLDNDYKEKLEFNLQSYLNDNADSFKGPQGDKGVTGERGPQGEQGPKGDKGDTGVIPNTDNWQKFQLTDSQGALRYVDLKNSLDNLRNLAGGTYYCANVPLDGISGTTSGAGYITMYRRNDNIAKCIQFRPYNSSQLFIMRFYNTWSTWEKQEFTVKSSAYDSSGNTKVTFNDNSEIIIQRGQQGIQGPKGDTGSIPNTDSWQKYALTDNTGSGIELSFNGKTDTDYQNLNPGLYYTTSVPITGVSSKNGFTLIIQRGAKDVKRAFFFPYNSDEVWTRRFYNSWSNWVEITGVSTLNQLKTTVEMQSALLTSLQQQIDALKGGNA